jgi:hypothetical protein
MRSEGMREREYEGENLEEIIYHSLVPSHSPSLIPTSISARDVLSELEQ